MRLTQNLFQVYELSGSAFQLGLTGLAQAIPLFALGLFGGTLADFVDRKKLLLITVAGNFLVAVALGILTLTGAIRVWHILIGTALTSALEYRPQSDSDGADLAVCAPFPFDQRRLVKFQRLPGGPFHRSDDCGRHPRVDGYRQRLPLQCGVLSPGGNQHYSDSNIGITGWQKREDFLSAAS